MTETPSDSIPPLDSDSPLEVSRLTRERDKKKLLAESVELDAVVAVAIDGEHRRLRTQVANATLALEEAKLKFAVGQLRPAPNEPWLVAGFVLFGLVLGFATGLTKTAGASQSLVTGIFGFVGGSLLSYSGFRRFTTEAAVEPRRVGQGLSGFSFGLLSGLVLGALLRVEPAAETKAAPAKAAPTASASSTVTEARRAPAEPPATVSTPAASVPAPSTALAAAAPAKAHAEATAAKEQARGAFYLNSDPSGACRGVKDHLGADGHYLDPSDAASDALLLYQLACSKPR